MIIVLEYFMNYVLRKYCWYSPILCVADHSHKEKGVVILITIGAAARDAGGLQLPGAFTCNRSRYSNTAINYSNKTH